MKKYACFCFDVFKTTTHITGLHFRHIILLLLWNLSNKKNVIYSLQTFWLEIEIIPLATSFKKSYNEIFPGKNNLHVNGKILIKS